MHWIADLLAAIGVVLNGIPQGIMAMGLGFAVFPTTFSFVLASAVNGAFGSVAPISFQAESLALTGNLGETTRERTSIIFGGSIIMAIIGVSGTLTKIVAVLGNSIMAGMMAGVGIMLAKIAVNMARKERTAGISSVAIAIMTYLLTKDLVWTIALSVIGSSLIAVFATHYEAELPAHVVERRFHFLKPIFNVRVVRGALSLACLNIGANISYGLITGQMTGIKPNPVNLNLLTGTQAFADMGTSLLGGAAGRNHHFRDCQRARTGHCRNHDDADHGGHSVCRLAAEDRQVRAVCINCRFSINFRRRGDFSGKRGHGNAGI